MAKKSNKKMSQDLVIIITSLVAIIISIIALFKQGFFGVFIDKITENGLDYRVVLKEQPSNFIPPIVEKRKTRGKKLN